VHIGEDDWIQAKAAVRGVRGGAQLTAAAREDATACLRGGAPIRRGSVYSSGAKSSKNGEKVPSRPSASITRVISQTVRRLTSRRRSAA
jgi:hypothetical protein